MALGLAGQALPVEPVLEAAAEAAESEIPLCSAHLNLLDRLTQSLLALKLLGRQLKMTDQLEITHPLERFFMVMEGAAVRITQTALEEEAVVEVVPLK